MYPKITISLLKMIDSHVCGRPLGLGHKLAQRMALCKSTVLLVFQLSYPSSTDLVDTLDPRQNGISFLPVRDHYYHMNATGQPTSISAQLLGDGSGPIPAFLLCS